MENDVPQIFGTCSCFCPYVRGSRCNVSGTCRIRFIISHSIVREEVPFGSFRGSLDMQIPIGSMYVIYGNIYHQYTPNVSIYTIHGSYGIWRCPKSGQLIIHPSRLRWENHHGFWVFSCLKKVAEFYDLWYNERTYSWVFRSSHHWGAPPCSHMLGSLPIALGSPFPVCYCSSDSNPLVQVP